MTTWKIKKVYIGEWSGSEVENQFNNSEDGWEPFAVTPAAFGTYCLWLRKPLEDAEDSGERKEG